MRDTGTRGGFGRTSTVVRLKHDVVGSCIAIPGKQPVVAIPIPKSVKFTEDIFGINEPFEFIQSWREVLVILSSVSAWDIKTRSSNWTINLLTSKSWEEEEFSCFPPTSLVDFLILIRVKNE